MDDIQEADDNDSEDDDDNSQDYEEHRSDWMLLSEMMPNRQARNLDVFSSHDIDRDHDWVNESLSRYPEIEEAESFIQHAIGNSEVVRRGSNSANIDRRSLNEKQRIIFERVESHCISRITNQSIDPLQIIIMGTAGTGKSYLINIIRERLCEIAKEYNSHENIIVLAPTGVAAFNIEGSTIHSSLSVPIYGTNVNELEGESLKRLQNKLKHIKYLIIDEMSMVG